MLDIRLTRPPDWIAPDAKAAATAGPDLAGLGARWRAFEPRATCSFFQSWSWLGCRASARFGDPLLLTVGQGGETVALGLFNRRRRLAGRARLWLHETGDAAQDVVYMEHNGLLVARGHEHVVAPALRHLLRRGHPLVLSGVDAAHRAAAEATGGVLRERAHPSASPFVDLAAVRGAPGGHLALLSANARQQIRRSLRRYAVAGEPSIARAASLDEARAWLAALGVLHQRTWTRRGRPGAFASAAFVGFHETLLAHAWPRGEIDLLRITAGPQVLGYLYNFCWRNRVANYQSGFDYALAGSSQHKPGLTCHHLAIAMYAEEGLDAYDLLAGDDRYKTSLATGAVQLHWLELLPRASLSGVVHSIRQRLFQP